MQLHSVFVKLFQLQNVVCLDVVFSQNLPFFSMQLNVGLTPVFRKFDLAVLKLRLFLNCEASTVSLFLINHLSVFNLRVSFIDAIKLDLVVFTPLPLLIL